MRRLPQARRRRTRVGPHLDGVVGRAIGSVEGFSYSDALAGHDGTWDARQIFDFLEDPKKFAPGTTMSFAGLPKPEDRANVIAYLAAERRLRLGARARPAHASLQPAAGSSRFTRAGSAR